MRAAVNGTELYFDVEGPQLVVEDGLLRSRPTVLVLHGGPGFDQGYLRPGLQPLAADAQLLFVDLRGQGRSAPAPLETCTLEQMADDVAALCELLRVDRPAVLGHSAGGFVALQLALRHPSLPAALILAHTSPTLAPLPDDDPPPTIAERGGPGAAAAAQRLFGGDFSPQAVDDFNRLVAPFYAGPQHTDVPAALFALSTFNGDVAGRFFNELAVDYDVRSRLHEIGIPTLVISGRFDWVCAPVAGRAIAAAIPGAALVVLPEAGHFGFSETPAPFLTAVRRHLRELSVASGRTRT
jgi:proline iminopeptidase